MNLDLYLTQYTKCNLKWIVDLNVKSETLQQKYRNLWDRGLSNSSLDMTPKEQVVF